MQGSDVGPTLFVICIIDSTNYVTKYADDASLLVAEKCDIDIKLEFQNVLKWAKNKLTKYCENKRTDLPPAECQTLFTT